MRKKLDKVENLECVYQGYGILEEEWVTDSQCYSVLGSTAKYDPNPSILSRDIWRTLLEIGEKCHVTFPSKVLLTIERMQNLIQIHQFFHKIIGGNHFWV